MSEHSQLHSPNPESALETSALDSPLAQTSGGGQSLPPPPSLLPESQPFQLQAIQRQETEEPSGGFTPVNLLGVARDAPDQGQDSADSGGVYLRDTPSTSDDSTILRRIPYQEQFFITAQGPGWYQVRTLQGEEGFVSSQRGLVSTNSPDTFGFTVHVVQPNERAQQLAQGYFVEGDNQSEFRPNSLDYAKAIWAYNLEHYQGQELGIQRHSDEDYRLIAGYAIWIPSGDWAYRYIRELPRSERHGDSLVRWAYEYASYDNPLIVSVRSNLESLAEGWNMEDAREIIEQLKVFVASSRDAMVGVVSEIPGLVAILPAGNTSAILANFASSFVIGLLDQALNTPPEVLQQVLRSFLTAVIDPEFNLGTLTGIVQGIGNWFTDLWDTVSAIGEFIGAAFETLTSPETYTDDIPELVQALQDSFPAVREFLQELELAELMAGLHGIASSMGEQLGAGAFSQIIGFMGASPFGQGLGIGKIIGYLIPEVVLAVVTSGGGSAIKGAATALRGVANALKSAGKMIGKGLAKVGPFLDDLIRFAMALVKSGIDAAKVFGKKLIKLLESLKSIGRGGARNALSKFLNGGEGFSTMGAFKKKFGAAGNGMAWHHIVEQHPGNVARFGAENIHHTKNLIKVPHGKGLLHMKISGHYSSHMPGTKIRVRDYVKTLSYDEQYEYGIKIMKKFGYNGPFP